MLSPDQVGREFEMRRTNVAREFTPLQLESQRALEILGKLLAELALKPPEAQPRAGGKVACLRNRGVLPSVN